MSDITPQPTSVYRYYDQAGLLLYVGITSRGIRRQREHNGDKEWWPFVTRQEVEHYKSRPIAAARERSLIQKYRPPFNKTYNLGHQQLQELYVAAVQAMPPRTQGAQECEVVLSPAEAFRSVRGKLPMTQIQRGNETIFAINPAFRSLILSAVPTARGDVQLLAPKKRGVMTNIDALGTSPQVTFSGDRGSIPRIIDAHLRVKVVSEKPFVVRLHEARGLVVS